MQLTQNCCCHFSYFIVHGRQTMQQMFGRPPPSSLFASNDQIQVIYVFQICFLIATLLLLLVVILLLLLLLLVDDSTSLTAAVTIYCGPQTYATTVTITHNPALTNFCSLMESKRSRRSNKIFGC